MKLSQLISRILIAVLTPILVVLGIIGCGDDDDDEVSEYGSPYVELHIDGSVADADGNPIQGIVFHLEDYNSVTSGADGKWSYSNERCSMFLNKKEVVVKAMDEDGEENGGEFAEKSVTVPLTQTAEADGWFGGAFEASDVVIEMDIKPDADAGTE